MPGWLTSSCLYLATTITRFSKSQFKKFFEQCTQSLLEIEAKMSESFNARLYSLSLLSLTSKKSSPHLFAKFCTLMHLFWSDVFKLQVWQIVEEVEGCDLGGHGWSVKTSRYTKASLNSRRRWENAQNPRSSVISGNCYSHLGFPFPSTHSWLCHCHSAARNDRWFVLPVVCLQVGIRVGENVFEVFRTDSEMLSFLNSLWKVSLVVGFFFGGSSHKVHNKFSSC